MMVQILSTNFREFFD